jgi:hypothetical protein
MCDLNAMIKEYGPATWFLTFSPGDWQDAELIQFLRDVNSDLDTSKLTANELIALDPVSVARFMDDRFKAILEAIYSDDHPLGGPCLHHFWRREYQQRGMDHFHMVAWVNDAPIIGVSSEEEIARFIMRVVSCALPDKKTSNELYNRITAFQMHKHNNYCLRNKKTVNGVMKVCRFGFGRPVTKEFVLRKVQASIVGRRKLKAKSRLYDLPRKECEVNINDYVPILMLLWNGNMDIQFVGDKSTALVTYILKYMLKSEKSLEENLMERANTNKSLCSSLWNFAMRSLYNRECGAMEAADVCLMNSLYGTDNDTTIKWLDVFMVRNRRVLLINKIKELEDDSDQLFFSSFIDDVYPNRPRELDNLCLYDFAEWYDLEAKKPKSENIEFYEIEQYNHKNQKVIKYLKKRKRGYVISHYVFKVKTQPENLYYSILLLKQPWRSTDELLQGFNTYQDAFLAKKDVLPDALAYFKKLTGREDLLEEMQQNIENELERQGEPQCQDDDDYEDLGCVSNEIENALRDFEGIRDVKQF